MFSTMQAILKALARPHYRLVAIFVVVALVFALNGSWFLLEVTEHAAVQCALVGTVQTLLKQEREEDLERASQSTPPRRIFRECATVVATVIVALAINFTTVHFVSTASGVYLIIFVASAFAIDSTLPGEADRLRLIVVVRRQLLSSSAFPLLILWGLAYQVMTSSVTEVLSTLAAPPAPARPMGKRSTASETVTQWASNLTSAGLQMIAGVVIATVIYKAEGRRDQRARLAAQTLIAGGNAPPAVPDNSPAAPDQTSASPNQTPASSG